MQLAERYDLAIVSADSRQVYAGFDIGTAKPSADERDRVPHYGIDVLAADGTLFGAAMGTRCTGLGRAARRRAASR